MSLHQNPLDEKEVTIVSKLAAGEVRKEIASSFGVSESAVCQRIRIIADIMRVPRKDAAIVAKALREGWTK